MACVRYKRSALLQVVCTSLRVDRSGAGLGIIGSSCLVTDHWVTHWLCCASFIPSWSRLMRSRFFAIHRQHASELAGGKAGSLHDRHSACFFWLYLLVIDSAIVVLHVRTVRPFSGPEYLSSPCECLTALLPGRLWGNWHGWPGPEPCLAHLCMRLLEMCVEGAESR